MKPYDILKSISWALAFMLIAPPVGAVILIATTEPGYTLAVLYTITILHVLHKRKSSKPVAVKPQQTSKHLPALNS